MALRSFTAPDGTAWRVWQVTPSAPPGGVAERRVRDRRSPDPVLRWKGAERREAERRKGLPRLPRLGGGLEHGWLVFECDGEKRRLAPPPEGWASLEEPELVALWSRADCVAKPPRRQDKP
ncbi:MAG TPA: hypothetical protein VF092_22655 [Longimicrobium sp.]